MAPSMRDYPTVKEYADAQKEIGSCAEEFKVENSMNLCNRSIH